MNLCSWPLRWTQSDWTGQWRMMNDEYTAFIWRTLNICSFMYWTPQTCLYHTPCHTFRTGLSHCGRQAQHGADWMTQLAYQQCVYKKLRVGGPAVLCTPFSPGYPWNSSTFWRTDMKKQFLQLTPIISHWAKTWPQRRQNLHEGCWLKLWSYFQNILSRV